MQYMYEDTNNQILVEFCQTDSDSNSHNFIIECPIWILKKRRKKAETVYNSKELKTKKKKKNSHFLPNETCSSPLRLAFCIVEIPGIKKKKRPQVIESVNLPQDIKSFKLLLCVAIFVSTDKQLRVKTPWTGRFIHFSCRQID